MGNLRSVTKALKRLGAEPRLVKTPAEVNSADGLILPGVGSFAKGMENLGAAGWSAFLHEWKAAGKPLLGICLGMQLLAEKGTEGGETNGLGLVKGTVRRFEVDEKKFKVPHVGWDNAAAIDKRMFKGVPDGAAFYFIHSYHLVADARAVAARCVYGEEFCAAVREGSVWGTQFHPEKSQKAGLRVLENFLNECGGAP